MVGMGAIVLNGAKIGANCLVGAGALVTEDKTYPDNSVIVGSPAKAVRVTDDQMRAMIARAADVYVKRWKRYAAGLSGWHDLERQVAILHRSRRHVHRHRGAGA